jgi:RHS repeat-associated protein
MKITKKPLIGTVSLLIAAAVSAQGLPPSPVSPTPVTTYEYDAQGNRTKITRGAGTLNLETKLSYDPLYRVKEHTDPNNGKTIFEHDGGDRTTQVTDPRNLVTQYRRDGFGNATQLISSDTGQASHTFDEAGNLITRTDSRGVLTTYGYDAGDRPTSAVSTLAGQPSESVTWAYSQTGAGFAYGIGRLTSTAHPAGSSQYRYNAHGQVVTDTQRVQPASGANTVQLTHAVTYGYTLGDLSSTTYPSGRVASMTLLRGRVQAVSLAKDASGTAVALITDVRWEPFERAVSSWQWNTSAGPVPHERFYDLSERITRYRLGPVFRDVRYDEASRITSFTHLLPDGTPQPALDQAFAHDENDRLTGITTATSSWSISYDPNGNRAGLILNGSLSTYNTEATSNRLASITNPARNLTYDNAGNTVSDSAGYSATYNLRGQLATLTKGGVTTTYTYNAFGQRVRKVSSTGPASTVVFVYDQAGHLLGEYDQNGAAIREYVWLRDTPIAMFMPDPANPSGDPLVYYIHTDHLNAPRIVMDRDNHVRWRWLAEPFGTTAPEMNPEGLGVFTQNLRFPGQYADAESGLWYNYFRQYDSSRGYIQSDPIGLIGGSLSTYAYVDGNPLSFVDPNGLAGCTLTWFTLVCEFGPPPIIDPDSPNPTPSSEWWRRFKNPFEGMFSTPRPKNMTRLEERQFDRVCVGAGDPCQALKNEANKAIDAAIPKVEDMLSDKGTMFGTQGWTNHALNLMGRIEQVAAIISLGQRMGCDMSAEIMRATQLWIPNFPRNMTPPK